MGSWYNAISFEQHRGLKYISVFSRLCVVSHTVSLLESAH